MTITKLIYNDVESECLIAHIISYRIMIIKKNKLYRRDLLFMLIGTGCSEDETGADAEVGGCADIVGNGGKGGDAVEGGGGSTLQGESCPQCGVFCWNSRILQLHLEEAHKTTFNAIDKNDLQAQFTQVVSSLYN